MQKIAIVAVLIKIFLRDRDQKTPQFDKSKNLPRHVVQCRHLFINPTFPPISL